MTAANFDAVMVEIFKHEGGYSTNKSDPGNWTGGKVGVGELRGTNMGIAAHAHPNVDIKNLTKAQAKEIYRKQYWNVIKGDDLPAGIDLVTMDGSVNSGVGRGPKWLQAALRVAQDGKIGPKTITAAWTANAIDTVNAACDARLGFLRGLKTYPTFGKGWERRVADVRKKALEMDKAPAYVSPDLPKPPDAPIHVEPMPAPKSGNPMALVIVGVVILAILAFVIFGAR